jgi:hypothetical protein
MPVWRATVDASPNNTWTLSTPSQSAANFYVNVDELVAVQDLSSHIGVNQGSKTIDLEIKSTEVDVGATATEVQFEMAFTGSPASAMPGAVVTLYTTGGVQVGDSLIVDFSTGGEWRTGALTFIAATELTNQQCRDLYVTLLSVADVTGIGDIPDDIQET